MAEITKTTDTIFRDILEDAVFVAREQALMPMLVTAFSATGYAQRDVPIWAQAQVQKVAEGVDYAGATKLSKSVLASFTPEVAMSQFLLTDQMMSTDPDNARSAAAQEMGGAIAERVDVDLLNLFSSFSTGKGTANAALTLAICAAALAVVRNNKGRGEAAFVLHPYQWHDVWTQLGQPATNAAFLGETANQALRDYYVSKQIGASWYTSSNIETDANSDAVGAVFTREAMAIDVREAMAMEPERDASRKAWELNASMGYAVGLLRSDRGVKITSDVTEPT